MLLDPASRAAIPPALSSLPSPLRSEQNIMKQRCVFPPEACAAQSPLQRRSPAVPHRWEHETSGKRESKPASPPKTLAPPSCEEEDLGGKKKPPAPRRQWTEKGSSAGAPAPAVRARGGEGRRGRARAAATHVLPARPRRQRCGVFPSLAQLAGQSDVRGWAPRGRGGDLGVSGRGPAWQPPPMPERGHRGAGGGRGSSPGGRCKESTCPVEEVLLIERRNDLPLGRGEASQVLLHSRPGSFLQ